VGNGVRAFRDQSAQSPLDWADSILTGPIDIILFCAGLIIWAMVALLALDNLGVQIKPLLPAWYRRYSNRAAVTNRAQRCAGIHVHSHSIDRSASGTRSP